MTDYSVLSDADVNELVATLVMGWSDVLAKIQGKAAYVACYWNPTQDHRHTALVRNRIAELKLERSFMFALDRYSPSLISAMQPGGSMSDTWEILNAPLRKQCEAALAAMEDHDE